MLAIPFARLDGQGCQKYLHPDLCILYIKLMDSMGIHSDASIF